MGHNLNFINDVKPLLTNCRCRFSELPSGLANAASISLNKSVDFPLLSLNVYGKSTQDGTPDPTNPVPIVSVGDDGTLSVISCGKNLLDTSSAIWRSASGSVVITPLQDGVSFLAPNFTLAKYCFFYVDVTELLNIGKTYTISSTSSGSDNLTGTLRLQRRNADGSYDGSSASLTITVEENHRYYTSVYPWGSGEKEVPAESTATYTMVQLEEGSTATAYKPYTGSTAAITSALPLCGLPVTEGGNYTDSNGQQWVCDELIYNANGTGKVVKRTAAFTFDGSDDESWGLSGSKKRIVSSITKGIVKFADDIDDVVLCLCNTLTPVSPDSTYKGVQGISFDSVGTVGLCFEALAGIDDITAWTASLAATPVQAVCELATPEEIELTAEEMAQLYKLYSHDGVTNIFNDEGAEMSISACTNPVLAAEALPIIKRLEAQAAATQTATTEVTETETTETT